MSLPTNQLDREETFLASMAGEDVTLPDNTLDRKEEFYRGIIQHLSAKVDKPSASTPANYVPTSDGQGGYAWQAGGGGGGILPILVVTAATGSTVTISRGSTTLTATESSGTWTFNPTSLGVWTATATKDGSTATATVNITTVKEYSLKLTYGSVFGVKRDLTASAPEWERTDDAVGFEFTPTVGSTIGSSDFDNVSPWKDIERVTIGSDVMVKIPNFYISRYRDATYEYIKVCDHQETGFVPAVQYGDTIPDYFYPAAYECGAGYTSVTGASPLTNITRATFRSGARAKGTGWGIIDARVVNAVNILILVETTSFDSQAVVGRGYCDGNSSSLATGSCDGITTGRPAGTSGKTGVTWRGIENWWGNVWEFVDGINWNGGQYYIGNDRDAYSDDISTGYTNLGYSGGTGWSSSYIKTFGLDENYPEQMWPNAVGASDTTYSCDAAWSTTGWRVVRRSGAWDSGSIDGAFAFNGDSASSYATAYYGSRLLYIAP